jgi:hypothetical protein
MSCVSAMCSECMSMARWWLGHVADCKRVQVRFALEDQGRRRNSGCVGAGGNHPLEFTDAGCTLEFLCGPGRAFHLVEWDDGDDDVIEPDPVPSPEMAE